jgi:hypothetical protein
LKTNTSKDISRASIKDLHNSGKGVIRLLEAKAKPKDIAATFYAHNGKKTY